MGGEAHTPVLSAVGEKMEEIMRRMADMTRMMEQMRLDMQSQQETITVKEQRAKELEEFHQILSDISWGKSSPLVKDFIIKAYVRGASCSGRGCGTPQGRRRRCELCGIVG